MVAEFFLRSVAIAHALDGTSTCSENPYTGALSLKRRSYTAPVMPASARTQSYVSKYGLKVMGWIW
jgi:hypothetical protein